MRRKRQPAAVNPTWTNPLLQVGYRQFCNKLWNVIKFVLNIFPEDYQPISAADVAKAVTKAGNRFADRWILHRLAETVKACNTGFQEYCPHLPSP